ncbi:hypothetical protein EI77_02880 [Prosthecobacter fusiformis]|uniref:Uncharacterized protein n=1 Tax=Prosthecobacter fusiformis TaxID=48464 RepID=A0A4R7RU18_9BACT|nr:hypothetical protein [Prosthecobacter fusiformis]TDU69232.1 hypothetical protein EI77_02880 [Prosthecobacter fusiformis]
MSEIIPLELSFRGQRPYLQGTALYEGAIAAIGDRLPEGTISIIFHSLLTKQPDLVIGTESLRHLREDPCFRAEMRFGTGDTLLHAALLESSRPVVVREACNEKDVISAAIVDTAGKSASLKNSSVGSLIEQVVFLNKRLHLQLLPELSPKWIFAKLELGRPLPPAPVNSLVLVLKQVLANRFTRSEILIDNERVGFISFSTPH